LFAQVSSIEESEVGELKKCVALFSKPNITNWASLLAVSHLKVIGKFLLKISLEVSLIEIDEASEI